MAVVDSGYDADFVNELPEELACIVCYHALKKPVQIADCGHRFCETCFQQLKIHAERNATRLLCPYDRDIINETHVFSDKAIERSVLSLQVRCSYLSAGCEWSGELRDLEGHEQNCNRKRHTEEAKISEDMYHQVNALIERVKNLEVGLEEKDQELLECKNIIRKHEEIIKQNQKKLTDCEGIMANQLVQIEILCNKVEVMEEELELCDWRIDWNELVACGFEIESEPFYTTSDLYRLSMKAFYNEIKKSFEVWLYRYRNNNEHGRIVTSFGFDYAIYAVCNNKVVDSYTDTFADFASFDISRNNSKSRGFKCIELSTEKTDQLRYQNFHIICRASAI